MTSSALKKYEQYCSEVDNFSHIKDIKEILKGTSSPTERDRLIAARLGQGEFRNRLIALWGSCSVTGFRLTKFLIASHIKPWSKSSNTERLDAYNGLLLTPNLDKAFDRFLISFSESGKIMISPELTELSKIAIEPSMSVTLSNRNHAYMKHHRDQFLEHS